MSTDSDAAWDEFDELVAPTAAASPWVHREGAPQFEPNLDLLGKLLAVPIRRNLSTQSGIPAKALDVWIAAELRRAGFGADEVWPRPVSPRVLSTDVTDAIRALPPEMADALSTGIRDRRFPIGSADAKILGKAYEKQVDVVISRWSRGVELMVSTKRMDSSFGKNLLNRVEESYGDAKNLRARHPLAALGFLFALRSTALQEEPAAVEKLMDLLVKLGREDDGYDAVGLVITQWSGEPASLDQVRIVHDAVPVELGVGRFLAVMIQSVLDRTPIDFHVLPRELLQGVELHVEEATDV